MRSLFWWIIAFINLCASASAFSYHNTKKHVRIMTASAFRYHLSKQTNNNKHQHHHHHGSGSSALHWISPESEAMFDYVSEAAKSSYIGKAVMDLTSTVSAPDLVEKNTQASLLNDLAHIALDFTSIFGKESSFLYQSALVFGNIFSVMSDYVPDQIVAPEQLVFRGLMLGAALNGLKDAALSMAMAGLNAEEAVLSYRERKVFDLLFNRVGVKRSQFDDLLVDALDWVTVEPGAVISNHTADEDSTQCNDDYVYWLYKGWVEVDVEGDDGMMSYSKVSRLDVGLGLIGEMNLSRRIEQEFIAENEEEGLKFHHPPMIVKAGDRGAQLLRINADRLMERLAMDDELSHSIHMLLIMGMQDKLHAMMKFTRISDCHDVSCPIF